MDTIRINITAGTGRHTRSVELDIGHYPEPATAGAGETAALFDDNAMVRGDAEGMNDTLVEIAQTLGVSANAEDILHAINSLQLQRVGGYSKVFADGTRAPAEDPRSDHVAVIDHATGLMWLVKSMGNPENVDEGISQEACANRCSELRALGFEDWRLPTRDELAGLVDASRRAPAIDTNLFPRVLPRWHWTSTPLVNTDGKASASVAWVVSFASGSVNNDSRNYLGFALAVRGAGQ